MAGFEVVDQWIEKLVAASWKERDPIKEQLIAAASELDNRSQVLAHLEAAMKGIDDLEARWEVEEVIESLTPPPAPAEEEPEESDDDEQDPNAPLSSKDLTLVYSDPRGILLHKSKVGERWFLTQRDPRTGQPQTFELHPQEVEQLKGQLEGSPYWVIGA